MTRRAGVLLNIASLPSAYGIGDIGGEAYKWIDRIADMGFTVWQILPTVPIGEGNSPYASPSAFAGNTLYISPDLLVTGRLITEAERKAAEYGGSVYTVDYDYARESKSALIKTALSRADDALIKKVRAFGKANPHIENYALYMAVKETQGDKPFWEWQKGLDFASVSANKEKYDGALLYHLFGQYLFFTQWAGLKEYASSKGVKLFGDMPIYVCRDSADLWSAPQLFQVSGKNAKPSSVAGVPPDYFSEDGQLWGNPLYNWAAMKKDGFSWWKQRIEASFKLYDILRIDHFRAFASYWAVPAKAESAKEGSWKKGPGMELFKAIGKPKGEIIAEDLGEFGEDVVALLEETGFPGMRVIQFGLDPDEDSTHSPHNYEKNTVAYVGTHDNNTLLGWLWDATPRVREYALSYCGASLYGWEQGGREAPACHKIIETVWRSASETAVIAFQDMCGFGADTRTNTPGVEKGNWVFRATKQAMNEIDSGYFRWLNTTFKR